MEIIKINILLSIYLGYLLLDRTDGGNDTKILSRRKRYLNFPEGSSLSVAICFSLQTYVIPPGIWTESLAWAVAYDLPNDTSVFRNVYGSHSSLKRRNRRDLYAKMEKVLNSFGYDGRTCILRSLCEATNRFLPKEDNLLYHILAIIFGFPRKRMLSSEPEEHHVYHKASQETIQDNRNCDEIYQCPFSLIDFALGEYAQYAS